MENKTVDVIIPAYHPGNEFATLIKRLEKQTVSIHRIIVMNTEESMWNKEWEKLSDAMEVHHLTKEEFDHGGTRARAAELSDSDVMVFMTQDAMPADRELLAELLKALDQEENIAAAYARQLPNAECSFVERYTRAFNYPDTSLVKTKADLDKYGIKTFFCSNVCAAYDHRIYNEIGGFPEHAIFNEDMIYAGWMVKKGYAVAYAAEAKVYHSHNYSCSQQFHRNFDLGVSQAEHPEVFEGVPSEGEGVRLVKKSLSYLLKTGHIWMIPGLFFQSASKYAGYFLGKRYQKLPERLILFCTMSPEYWKKQK